MGICGSSDLTPEEQERLKAEKARNKALEARMKGERDSDTRLNKLLLLGAGESGKSTLFKQMVMIYATEQKLSESDKQAQVETVFGNVIGNAKALCEAIDNGHGEPSSAEAKDLKLWIEELKDDCLIDPEIASKIKTFWLDSGVQELYSHRSSYQLNDSTAYFMNQVDTIGAEGWLPNKDDILRTRVRTTGIVEHDFTIDANPFKMFDVGGQRNERKKWIHCFENVTAVMFVAAISEFDQVLYEDEHTNRVTEAIHLFDEISNSEWFKNTSMILFLNKRDLFEDKIKTLDITACACEELHSFTGNCRSFEETTEFIKSLFVSLNRSGNTTYAHITCATDSDNVAHVFNDVKDVIIQKSLEDAGLA
jgi:GTPase SAR1 family protein